jgi:hypothetical protein
MTDIFLEDRFDLYTKAHLQTLIKLRELEDLINQIELGQMAGNQVGDLLRVLLYFSVEERSHHLEEEAEVLSKFKILENHEINQMIRKLYQDHSWLEQNWTDIQEHLIAVVYKSGWFDLLELRRNFEIFNALSLSHIKLEESIFPQILRITQISKDIREVELVIDA